MEERGHHSIILKQESTPKVSMLAFKVFSDSDLDKAEKWFKDRSLPTEWVERSFQKRTLRD